MWVRIAQSATRAHSLSKHTRLFGVNVTLDKHREKYNKTWSENADADRKFIMKMRGTELLDTTFKITKYTIIFGIVATGHGCGVFLLAIL